MLVMKKILVIGGSGFLGSHVADALMTENYDVWIFDKIQSPYIQGSQKMIVGDVEDFEALKKAIEGAETVLNFAAVADIQSASEFPIASCKINVLGNLHCLEACRLLNVKRYVLASTVYVNSAEGQLYKCSKQAAELYVREYSKIHGLDHTILRYGSLYGPRADKTNGIRKIIENALQTKTIEYFGHPDSLRQYVHVIDAASATLDLLGKQGKNKTFVITGNETVAVRDFLYLLAEILNYPEDAIKFTETNRSGHYIRTPYNFDEQLCQKYFRNTQIEFAQGILQVIKDKKTDQPIQ